MFNSCADFSAARWMRWQGHPEKKYFGVLLPDVCYHSIFLPRHDIGIVGTKSYAVFPVKISLLYLSIKHIEDAFCSCIFIACWDRYFTSLLIQASDNNWVHLTFVCTAICTHRKSFIHPGGYVMLDFF